MLGIANLTTTASFGAVPPLTSPPLATLPRPLAAPPLADAGPGAGALAGDGPHDPRPLEPDAILLHRKHNFSI